MNFKAHRRFDVDVPKFILIKACPFPPEEFNARTCIPSPCMSMTDLLTHFILPAPEISVFTQPQGAIQGQFFSLDYRMRQGGRGV